MTGPLLLRVTGVHASYGPAKVLHGVSLDLHRGEIVALVGSNGAGKTTLLNCISGLHPVGAGRIEMEGVDLRPLRPSQRVAIGLCQVPEGRHVFPRLSVEDNLLLGAYRRNRDGRAGVLQRVMELFPVLRQQRRQLAGLMSGGQQQMLALGRALMADPVVLLLDEPSMGIAPAIVEQIFESIVELSEAGVTVLLVEQNARAALALADRAYVIEAGRITLSGTGHDLGSDRLVQAAYLGLP